MEVDLRREESEDGSHYNRAKEVESFDETKAGVKGLLDAGLVKIPRMFIHSKESLKGLSANTAGVQLQVPVIDLEDIVSCERRREVVREIRVASETWGFFQLINHGIPKVVLSEMLEGVRQFHEQTREVKMELYSRDQTKPVKYYSNGDLHVSKAANWRDTISFFFADDSLDNEAIPLVCREATLNYMKHIFDLRDKLCGLLSEALGLSSDFLGQMECMKSEAVVGHYYPACPEPDLTLGATKHSDPSFLTLVLQDNVGGLQVLNQNLWVDVPPIQGALVANLGDLMQVKSVEHRVLARGFGTRVSTACFFYPSVRNRSKPYGPTKEFVTENSSPIYRETSASEYLAYYVSQELDGRSNLPHFKLQS